MSVIDQSATGEAKTMGVLSYEKSATKKRDRWITINAICLLLLYRYILGARSLVMCQSMASYSFKSYSRNPLFWLVAVPFLCLKHLLCDIRCQRPCTPTDARCLRLGQAMIQHQWNNRNVIHKQDLSLSLAYDFESVTWVCHSRG